MKKATKENQLKEAEKYGERALNLHGFLIEKSDVGVRYDYSTCRDPEWEQLKTDFDSIKKRMEDRQGVLKAIKEHLVVVDEGSGEVTKIYPPAKSGKEGLKFTMQ